jgi:predicted DNA-binding transcriptional regulator AlpA
MCADRFSFEEIYAMRLISVKEGSTILGTKPPRTYELIRRGYFPPGVVVRVGHKQLRFSEDGLKRWIEAGGNNAKSDGSEVVCDDE